MLVVLCCVIDLQVCDSFVKGVQVMLIVPPVLEQLSSVQQSLAQLCVLALFFFGFVLGINLTLTRICNIDLIRHPLFILPKSIVVSLR